LLDVDGNGAHTGSEPRKEKQTTVCQKEKQAVRACLHFKEVAQFCRMRMTFKGS
jgi:hypothetical protein